MSPMSRRVSISCGCPGVGWRKCGRCSLLIEAMKKIYLSIVFVCCAAPLLRAQSDPMAKWKPNVGDVFLYFHTVDNTRDTVREVIVSTNYFYDSAYPSVVVVRDSTLRSSHEA